MRKLDAVLKEFLDKTGGSASLVLDEVPAETRVTHHDRDALVERLYREAATTRRLIVTVAATHVVILLLAAFMVVWQRDNPAVLGPLLGGSVIALLAISRSLLQAWREKTVLDMLLAILPTLSPKDALKAVQAYYYAQLSASQSRGNSQGQPSSIQPG